jgi:hypothetical protein
MPHILISDCDNPEYASGTIIISVLSLDKAFERDGHGFPGVKGYGHQGMYGIDADGKQTENTNSIFVKHFLIKDCTENAFRIAMAHSPRRIKTPVLFRVLPDELVEKKPLANGQWPRNKVDLDAVFQIPCDSSQIPCDSSDTPPEEQPQNLASAVI